MPKATLPNRMDRFTASIHQASYRALALSASYLFSVHLRQEIVAANNQVLRNARQCLQACSHSMALVVAGKWAIWFNLSDLPDSMCHHSARSATFWASSHATVF